MSSSDESDVERKPKQCGLHQEASPCTVPATGALSTHRQLGAAATEQPGPKTPCRKGCVDAEGEANLSAFPSTNLAAMVSPCFLGAILADDHFQTPEDFSL